MGEHRLKGLETDTALYELLPASLNERKFPLYGSASNNPESKKMDEELKKIRQENEQLQAKLAGIQSELKQLESSAGSILVKLSKTGESGNNFYF